MRRALVATLFPALVGCGHPVAGADDPSRCSPLVHAVPDEGQAHVAFGTRVSYQSNPPASGPHWPSPHPWGLFPDPPVSREWWVHNLEHGGIVLLFNCPSASDGGSIDGGSGDGGSPPACPEVVAVLELLRSERALDSFNEIRVLVTADPLAPKRVSEVAWGWVWQSDTVDLAAMRCFRDARYDRGPEHAP